MSGIYRSVPKKFVMFYFSVKSKYIKGFFGTDYQKKVSLSTNPLKSSKNKTAGYRRVQKRHQCLSTAAFLHHDDATL